MTKHFIRRIVHVAATLLCLSCMILPALAVPADSPSSCSSRVHHKASAGSAVIGRLENGTKVTVLDETDDFYKISCYETDGYIAKEQLIKKDGKYYVNCTAGSDDTQAVSYVPMADALQLRSSILELSQEQLSKPYIRAGSGPRGFDCSGLAYYVYGKNGFTIQRSADVQMSDGLIIPRDSLQVGDLVFFRNPYSRWLATHVGIYAGNNKMIHSASGGVQYTDLDTEYYASRYVGARRIVNVSTEGVELAPSAASAMMPRIRTGMRTAD